MRLERLCVLELQYTGDFHLVTPYDESGSGWGVGAGYATGERLSGAAQWSNHPSRRGDGAMLPDARGVITTPDGAEVMFTLTGRTVFVDSPEVGGDPVGRQLLMALFESADQRYRWLGNTVCVAEGRIDPERLVIHLEVDQCLSDLA